MALLLLLLHMFAPDVETTHGAVLTASGKVLTWGSTLAEWDVASVKARTLRKGPFGEGGCLADLDGDGAQEFIAVRGNGPGDLMWMPLDGSTEEAIDDEVEAGDCTEAELFGKRGVLIIHRGAQVRFYQRSGEGKWTSRDIYSIYTPSYQRGLALGDVNGDGRLDIFCGNYWIESPARFEESWRLFAIHTWFEDPDSAALRIAVASASRIAAGQARVSPARLAWFESPSDPRQQWKQFDIRHRLGTIRALAWSKGKLVAAGDGGVEVDGRSVYDQPVTAIAVIGNERLFASGPGGAKVLELK